MRYSPLNLLAAAPLLATAACSATVTGSPEAVDADANATSAVVVIERTVGSSDARATAVARFVRMRSGAVDEDALRMVGATVDFPAMGTCEIPSSVRPTGSARAVELLDVGAIALETRGQRTILQARQLPDVVNLLSGFVYATPTADADALPPRTTYVLRAAGSIEQDVAPFAVSASAPDEPSSLRLADQDVASVEGPVSLTALAADASVEVAWEAGSADDFVYVDISGATTTSEPVRCLFADVGHAALAGSLFGAGGTIAVHRLHREPFRAKGVDSGEVRFDFARVLAYSRQ